MESNTKFDPYKFDFEKEFSMEVIREESKSRGWLFNFICAWCLTLATICIVAGFVALIKGRFFSGGSSLTQASIGILLIGWLIVFATAAMWKLNTLGRNVAIITVGCLMWIIGTQFNAQGSHGLVPQIMTVVFAALSISCFTSPHGRQMFSVPVEDEPTEDGTEGQVK